MAIQPTKSTPAAAIQTKPGQSAPSNGRPVQTAPTAPAAPAQPAAKAAKKPKPQATFATPEDKAKFEALMADVKANQKKAAELKAAANQLAGITPKKGGTRAVTASYGGFSPEARVTLVDGNVPGFASDEDKAIRGKIPANGMTLKELLSLPDTSYGWFMSRLGRGSFKVNGATMAEAFNKLGPQPSQAQAA